MTHFTYLSKCQCVLPPTLGGLANPGRNRSDSACKAGAKGTIPPFLFIKN